MGCTRMRAPARLVPPGLAEGGPVLFPAHRLPLSRHRRCRSPADRPSPPRGIADYQRAAALRDRYQHLAYGVTDQVRWVYTPPSCVSQDRPGRLEFRDGRRRQLTRAPAFDDGSSQRD